MKHLQLLRSVLAAALITVPLLAAADARADLGRQEYDENCALCHGRSARGDGAFGQLLELTIPDLTTLSRRNGGVFPVDRVYAVIDGREDVKGHGPREMPIWGRYFATRSAPDYEDFLYAPEAFVRARILVLIDYLNRLQVK